MAGRNGTGTCPAPSSGSPPPRKTGGGCHPLLAAKDFIPNYAVGIVERSRYSLPNLTHTSPAQKTLPRFRHFYYGKELPYNSATGIPSSIFNENRKCFSSYYSAERMAANKVGISTFSFNKSKPSYSKTDRARFSDLKPRCSEGSCLVIFDAVRSLNNFKKKEIPYRFSSSASPPKLFSQSKNLFTSYPNFHQSENKPPDSEHVRVRTRLNFTQNIFLNKGRSVSLHNCSLSTQKNLSSACPRFSCSEKAIFGLNQSQRSSLAGKFLQVESRNEMHTACDNG